MFRKTLFACLVIMSAAVTACDEDPTSSGPAVAGTWTGRLDAYPDFSVTVTLQEGEGQLAGTGQWGLPNDVDAMTVRGVRNGNTVAFKITTTGITPADFTGALTNESRMVGKLNGSGFRGESITFLRQ